MNIVLGMKILWIFFWGHLQIGLVLRGFFLCILGSFLKVNIQNLDIFLGCKNFKYFLGALEISDIFWGVKGRCRVRAYVCKNK